MRHKRRLQLVIAVVLLSLLMNFWLGEHNSQLVPIDHVCVLLVAMCLTPCLLWRVSRAAAIFSPLLVLFGGTQAWLYGSHEHAVALYNCLEHCGRVQSALETYRRSHGAYPASLGHLHQRLPAQVIFPPQILKYKRTQDGYAIWIADELVSYQGSQSQEFGAHK